MKKTINTMKKITRNFNEVTVKFINVNIESRSMTDETTVMPIGTTEKQAEKELKKLGFNPVNIEIEKCSGGSYSMNYLDFFLCGEEIEKKTDISGRSVTRNIKVGNVHVIAADKNGDKWQVIEKTVWSFDGEFNSAWYTGKFSKILEILDAEPEREVLIGMSEEKFRLYGTENR